MILATVVYYLAVIAFAYWIGRRGAGYGIAVFLVAVFVQQMVVDGPESLIEHNGCERYSSVANDC